MSSQPICLDLNVIDERVAGALAKQQNDLFNKQCDALVDAIKSKCHTLQHDEQAANTRFFDPLVKAVEVVKIANTSPWIHAWGLVALFLIFQVVLVESQYSTILVLLNLCCVGVCVAIMDYLERSERSTPHCDELKRVFRVAVDGNESTGMHRLAKACLAQNHHQVDLALAQIHRLLTFKRGALDFTAIQTIMSTVAKTQ